MTDQHLVDAVAVHVHHFESPRSQLHMVGPAGDPAKHHHQEARDGVVLAGMRPVFDAQHPLHIHDRRHAIHQPSAVVAADDLLLHLMRSHQVAHHGAHHVVQGDHPDH